MSEDANQDEAKPKSETAALAASVPDDNHMLMRMVRMLIEPKQPKAWPISVLSSVLGGAVILLYVVAKWGVPAILAAQSLILQLHGDDLKDRASARELATQQVDATKGLQGSVERMATTLGGKIDTQSQRIDAIAGDVRSLQSHQAKTDAQVRSIARQHGDEAH